MITVKNMVKAWEMLLDFIPNANFKKNEEKTEVAGYSIYDFGNGWVSDLRTRLEVNFENGKTYNVWIEG